MLALFLSHTAVHAAVTVRHVDPNAGGGTLQIGLSRQTVFKVVQLGAREIMVAFKSADVSPSAAGSHSGTGLVAHYTLEELPDQVVSLMINTTLDVHKVQAEWQNDAPNLIVHLLADVSATSPEIPVKRRKYKKDIRVSTGSASVESEAPEPVFGSDPKLADETVSGDVAKPALTESTPAKASLDISNLPTVDGLSVQKPEEAESASLFVEISKGACAKSPLLADALTLCRKNQWEKAFSLLSVDRDSDTSEACLADVYYLKALSAFKMNTDGTDRLYLDAVSCFQDALNYYPNAAHAPFAILTLAAVYNELGSTVEARGYYKLIIKTYAEHSVSAEALLALGKLYAKEGKHDLAIANYRRYLKAYPQSELLTEVRLALGKSLYELNELAESMEMFSQGFEADPRCVYKDPDLLVYIGKLKYQLGDSDGAREAFVKAVNLYPDRDDMADLFTRIGDTLKDGGREKEAKKIYELVIEKYPDSDGFAISAIRYADLLLTHDEKEEAYRMVIERFPEHPVAKLAVIRLADLRRQAGAYHAGIKTLRSLMSGELNGLEDEAEYVMALCFKGYLEKLAEQKDPLAVVAAYEKDKALIDRFEDSEIFETVGTAFFQTKFFNRAEKLFQESYTVSSHANRPASLYYHFAETLQELGKNMQAREMFLAYFQKLPENEHNPDAYLNMARLLAADESWESALSFIKGGFRKSEGEMQKVQFLVLQAEVYAGMGREAEVPDLIIKAINLMASSKEATNELLMNAYRQLGGNYMTLSAFEKAADAFNMALNFSEGSRPPALLYQLAQSYLQSQDPEAARMALVEIVGAGDEFWARMAEEQLRTMVLEEKLGRQEDDQ